MIQFKQGLNMIKNKIRHDNSIKQLNESTQVKTRHEYFKMNTLVIKTIMKQVNMKEELLQLENK